MGKNDATLHLQFRCTWERPVVEALEVVGLRISVCIPSDLLLDPRRRRGRRRHGVVLCLASSSTPGWWGSCKILNTNISKKCLEMLSKPSGSSATFFFPFQAGRRHSGGGQGERGGRGGRGGRGQFDEGLRCQDPHPPRGRWDLDRASNPLQKKVFVSVGQRWKRRAGC